MRARDLNLQIPQDPDRPKYQLVAAALAEAIAQGRLQPGTALPGVRELAKRLDLNRNTVLAALAELRAQGLVESREREGIFVRATAAAPTPSPGPPTRPGFDLPNPLGPPTEPVANLLDLSEPLADQRLAPAEALARATARALRLPGGDLLGRGDPRGSDRLRTVLAAHLGESRGLVADPERILITRGTRMGLALVVQVLVGSAGGAVAVEDPLRPSWREVLHQAAPVELLAVPVDRLGLDVEALSGLLERKPLRMVLVTPACQDPTGVRLAPERRRRLLELARDHRFAIVELDVESGYDLSPAPPHPLAAEDPSGQVVHVGGFSQLIAPGFRLGYLTAAGELADAIAKARQRLDWQGDRVLEWSLADLMEEGEFGRHLRRIRRAAEERGEALQAALREELDPALAWERSTQGMGLWVRGRGPLGEPPAFQRWLDAALHCGAKAAPSRPWHLDGRTIAATRLGFTAFEPAELRAAVWRLGRALQFLA